MGLVSVELSWYSTNNIYPTTEHANTSFDFHVNDAESKLPTTTTTTAVKTSSIYAMHKSHGCTHAENQTSKVFEMGLFPPLHLQHFYCK